MNKKIISLTTSSLLIFQNVAYLPNVYAQEMQTDSVIDTQNAKSKSIVYLADADGSETDGDGSQSSPYQNIQTALDNVADGGIIRLVGDVTYTKYKTHTDGSALPLIINKNVIIEGASGKSPLASDADSFSLRAPIQLDANVTFRNIKLELIPETTLGEASSNNGVLGEVKPLAATIFVAGNTLTLDNVNTKVGTSANQSSQRPYISGGSFKGVGNVGSKSIINIVNPNSETILSGIYAGDYWNSRTLNVEINLDGNVLENKIYTGGLNNTLNGTVSINLGDKSTVYSFDNTNHQGEINVRFRSGFTRDNVDLNNVDNLTIDEATKILLKKDSSFDLNNVTLKKNSLIDFREISGTPTVKGNFSGNDSSILLNDTQTLDIAGELTGISKLNYDSTVFKENLTVGHEYVKANSSSSGDFVIDPNFSSVFNLEKDIDGNNRATWTVRKVGNTFKTFSWGDDCPDVITNPLNSDEYVFPINFVNSEDKVYLPYNEEWDDFIITITKEDGTELDYDSVYDDNDLFFYISYLGSALVLSVDNPNYSGEVLLTVKHPATNQIITKTVSINRELKDITGTVSIVGDATPGNVLKANITGLPEDVKRLKYTWYLNDSVLEGENGSTLTLTEKHVGTIRVKVDVENYKGSLVSKDVIVKLPEKPVIIKPGVVGNLKATSNSYDSNKITWTSLPEAHGYEVYSSTSEKGAYSLISTVSNANYTDTNLTTGVTYYYKVRAYKVVDGERIYGDFSSVVSAKPSLSSVTAKASSASYNSNKVTWNKVSGADGYVVYRATSKDGSYSSLKTITSGSTVSFTDSSLSTGKTYYYKVRAYKTVDGKKVYSPYSSVVSAKPSLSSTTAKASSASYNSNKVTWSKVSGASGYVIYRSTSKDGTYSALKTIASGNTVSFTDSSLTTGKTYYYKVRAYRTVNGKKVYSSYSSVVSAKPNLKAPSISLSTTSKKATTKWSKITGANGYEVYRATSKDGSYSKVKTITSGSTVSHTDSGLTKGKTYYYKVRAYRTVNGKKVYSSYSSVKSIKVK